MWVVDTDEGGFQGESLKGIASNIVEWRNNQRNYNAPCITSIMWQGNQNDIYVSEVGLAQYENKLNYMLGAEYDSKREEIKMENKYGW